MTSWHLGLDGWELGGASPVLGAPGTAPHTPWSTLGAPFITGPAGGLQIFSFWGPQAVREAPLMGATATRCCL